MKKWTKDKVIAIDAVRGLANYHEKSVPDLLLKFIRRHPADQSAAIDTLVSRRSYAQFLLQSVTEGSLPANAISQFQARQIQSLGDVQLNQQLTELWGDLNMTSEAQKAEIAVWKKKLSPELMSQADVAKGKVVYQKQCGACHKLYGEGGAIGPDLTGSDRGSIDYLLGNIISPNDVVPSDYRLTIFRLKDGRVVSGVVPEESPQTVTIQSLAERFTIDKSQIEAREVMPMSLMPEGLIKVMDEAAVRDLMAYLMSYSEPTEQ